MRDVGYEMRGERCEEGRLRRPQEQSHELLIRDLNPPSITPIRRSERVREILDGYACSEFAKKWIVSQVVRI